MFSYLKSNFWRSFRSFFYDSLSKQMIHNFQEQNAIRIFLAVVIKIKTIPDLTKPNLKRLTNSSNLEPTKLSLSFIFQAEEQFFNPDSFLR